MKGIFIRFLVGIFLLSIVMPIIYHYTPQSCDLLVDSRVDSVCFRFGYLGFCAMIYGLYFIALTLRDLFDYRRNKAVIKLDNNKKTFTYWLEVVIINIGVLFILFIVSAM
jgi:hypothetical protein